MKQFLLFIGKIMVVLFLVAYVLDFGYSHVYSNTTKRNKVENVINTQDKNLDVIMMGSSRANNHFVAQLFVDKGFKAFNYGISGSKLQETALLLEIMIKNNYKIKSLLLEVDLNLNSDSFSFGNQAKFMPFINSNAVVSEYYKDKLPDYASLAYIPFYRYIKYEPQIGFREFFFTLVQRKSNSLNNYGFYPLFNIGNNMNQDLLEKTPKKNASYEQIKKLCIDNNIQLISITTPVCENTRGIEYFTAIKEIYPEVINFENLVTEDQYFSSCGHLNDKGAMLFTAKIIAELNFKK